MATNHTNRTLSMDVSTAELLTMRARGMSNIEIAAAVGVSRATIYRHIGAERPRKKDEPKPMKSQTEKFMERLERSSRTDPPPKPAKAPEWERGMMDKSQEPGANRPRPVRVLMEYAVGDQIRIVVENGKVSITGAQDMDAATARQLCRTIMLLRLEEETL